MFGSRRCPGVKKCSSSIVFSCLLDLPCSTSDIDLVSSEATSLWLLLSSASSRLIHFLSFGCSLEDREPQRRVRQSSSNRLFPRCLNRRNILRCTGFRTYLNLCARSS